MVDKKITFPKIKTFTTKNSYSDIDNSDLDIADWLITLGEKYRSVRVTHLTSTTRKHYQSDSEIITDTTIAVEVVKNV